MKLQACLICLKSFGYHEQNGISSEHNSDPPLLPKFLKFAENYLHVSSDNIAQLLVTILSEQAQQKQAFCEKCELAVISPICQVYLQFLSSQLRLSWELKQLVKSLNNSKADVDNVQEFRSLLSKKCQIKERETFPCVTLRRAKLPVSKPRELERNTMNESLVTNCKNSKQLQVPFPEQQRMFKRETENLHREEDEDDDYDDADDFIEHSDSDSEGTNDSSPATGSSSNRTGDLDPENYGNGGDQDPDYDIDVEEHILKIEIHDDHEPPFNISNEEIDEASQGFSVAGVALDHEMEMKRNKKQEMDKDHPNSCPHCLKNFPHKAHLNMHISKAHPSKTKQKQGPEHEPISASCHICGKLIKNRKYLSGHFARYHPSHPTLNTISWLKCPKCRSQFAWKSSLKSHMKRCIGSVIIPPQPRPESYAKSISFPCNQCPTAFFTKDELNKHLEDAHKPKFSFTFIAEEFKWKLKKS